jgi:hypothetical protein
MRNVVDKVCGGNQKHILRSTTSFSQICAINVIRNNYFFFTSTPVM